MDEREPTETQSRQNPEKDMGRLQRIQNLCAKLVLKAGPRDSTTLCLYDLHWLPVRYRIMYKVLSCVQSSPSLRSTVHSRIVCQEIIRPYSGFTGHSACSTIYSPQNFCRPFPTGVWLQDMEHDTHEGDSHQSNI